MLYCKDFEKYNNYQKWFIFQNGKKINIIAIRNQNTYTWDGYIEYDFENIGVYTLDIINKIAHGGITHMDREKLGFSFSKYNDYKPKYEEMGYYKPYFKNERIEQFKYWSFPEVKSELEYIETSFFGNE